MRKKLSVLFLLSMILFLLVLPGCNLPWDEPGTVSNEAIMQTQVAETIAALQLSEEAGMTQEALPSPEENTPIPTPTETMMPSATMTETATATTTMNPTPEKVMVSVSMDTNCRSGPGTIYDYLGALLEGEEAEVLGKSVDGEYWIIKNPDRTGECWLWGYYASVVGQTSDLPSYTPPPTPTPVFNWAGTWALSLGPVTGPPVIGFVLTITVDGKNLDGYADLGGGDSLTISGTISDDYLSVSGNWVGPTNIGTYEFFALGVNQFQGNYTDGINTYAWCGNRGGAAVPSPCYKN